LLCIETHDKPGKPYPPKITSITQSSVTLTYTRPHGANVHKIIEYTIKYRTFGGHYGWQSVHATTSLSTTVTGLSSHTKYQFVVVARYQNGEFGPASDPVLVDTKSGSSKYYA